MSEKDRLTGQGSYSYRRSIDVSARTDLDRQKLGQALSFQRAGISTLSLRLRALCRYRDRRIAHALWDGIAVSAVAAATAMTTTRARKIGLAFEDLSQSGTPAGTQLQLLRSLAQNIGQLATQLAQIQARQDQLVMMVLRMRLLDSRRIAVMSGLSLERVHSLAPDPQPTPALEDCRDESTHAADRN